MEKINIAELLKDCPKGMELDCTMFDNVSFIGLQDSSFPIIIHTPDGCKFLTPFGCYHESCSAKCIIFPKGKNTWEKFVLPYKFKDGDILATDLGSVFILNTHFNTNECYGCYTGVCCDGVFYINEPFAYKECCNLATKEEKEELFQTIKARGYKWNPETKTLEKLIVPKFKVGDKIKNKNSGICDKVIEIFKDCYLVESCLNEQCTIGFDIQDNWELVPHKFDINTFKPFDQILVRLTNNCVWIPKFFSHLDNKNVKYYPFVTTDNVGYPQCVPYKGNEHLCRTTDDCDKFYRVWEK